MVGRTKNGNNKWYCNIFTVLAIWEFDNYMEVFAIQRLNQSTFWGIKNRHEEFGIGTVTALLLEPLCVILHFWQVYI
jgi:hypothetical protein